MTVLTWTDDRVEQLKKLWEAGLSASQIAAELGNVTRNAVIGKVHRLGLSGRAKSPSSAAPRQRKARPAQHMMRVSRPHSRGNTALAHAFEVEMEPDPIAYDNVVPMSQRLSLLELSEATCHWPIGDPVQFGILLLRRQGAAEPALLRASLAHRLPARQRPPPAADQADEVESRRPGRVQRPSRCIANRDPWLCEHSGLRLCSKSASQELWMRCRPGTTTIPPWRTCHPAHSPRRARCGSDPARRPG